jgi:integrase
MEQNMAQRTYKRLTVVRAKELAKAPGMHPDGDGLYLAVTKAGVASWIYRYMLGRHERSMGLGPLRHVGLADARRLADEARRLKREGVDPIEHRRARQRDEALAVAKAVTFKQCAVAYITAHRAGWKSAKHAAQWSDSLERYAYPVFGGVSVQAVDTALVMSVVEPIWNDKPETASRVRGRIEAILDWSASRGHREGDNPARWRGHLENLLPARRRVRQVVHHAALPYAEIGSFMGALRAQNGVGDRALEFLILTATRTSEARGARWSEISLPEQVWIIPPARTKAGTEHRVPLSDAALAIVEAMREARSSDYVFSGIRGALGSQALAQALHRLRRDVTVHGFRSSFRSWAADHRVPHEIAEMALGHAIPAAVVRAYQRSNLLEQRRRLMDTWARFCAEPDARGAEVVQLAALR